MAHTFMKLSLLSQKMVPLAESSALEIVIVDAGPTDGIEVVICAVDSDQIVFEAILVDPESQALLTHGSPETEAFWQCLNLHCCVSSTQDIFLTARCFFDPLTITVSPNLMGQAETRNAQFHRLVEAMLDELQTWKPDSAVQVTILMGENKVVTPINSASECPRCSKF